MFLKRGSYEGAFNDSITKKIDLKFCYNAVMNHHLSVLSLIITLRAHICSVYVSREDSKHTHIIYKLKGSMQQ